MSELEVQTTAGVVRGTTEGHDLRVWRGIPFAAPPTGPLRFRAPQPPTPWSGIRQATEYGAGPPQKPIPLGVGAGRHTRFDEDCLTVNVVAPRQADRPLPVMVWIYGGAFKAGAAASPLYTGFELVRNGDVVFVSFNYRLGALGFTDFTRYSTADRPIESNLGLRDMVAALQWVRDNIADFGGDPDAVTIFGQSAGAASVTTLLAVPAAAGLFHAAIAQSPAPHFAYSSSRHQEWAAQLIGLLGAEEKDAVTVLSNVSAHELVAAGEELNDWVNQATPGASSFAPVVDGDFLPLHPTDAAALGRTHPVPLIIGTNDRESAMFVKVHLRILPTSGPLLDRMFAQTDPAARERVLDAYPHNDIVGVSSDHCFFWPALQMAEGHSTVAPTWMYRYDFAPRLLKILGVDGTHISELPATFGIYNEAMGRVMTLLGGHRALHAVSRRMQGHWTHFAHHGEPDAHWPAYSTPERQTLVIDQTDRAVADPHPQRRLAWSGFSDYR